MACAGWRGVYWIHWSVRQANRAPNPFLRAGVPGVPAVQGVKGAPDPERLFNEEQMDVFIFYAGDDRGGIVYCRTGRGAEQRMHRRSKAPADAAATTKQNNQASGRRARLGRLQTYKDSAYGKADGATSGDADAKKHLAGVKYEDRQASSVQTLDGASKDAAKSDTTPAKTGESQSAANAQDSKKQ